MKIELNLIYTFKKPYKSLLEFKLIKDYFLRTFKYKYNLKKRSLIL